LIAIALPDFGFQLAKTSELIVFFDRHRQISWLRR
jgi:hypothetical protein